jgi:hypothetical protein
MEDHNIELNSKNLQKRLDEDLSELFDLAFNKDESPLSTYILLDFIEKKAKDMKSSLKYLAIQETEKQDKISSSTYNFKNHLIEISQSKQWYYDKVPGYEKLKEDIKALESEAKSNAMVLENAWKTMRKFKQWEKKKLEEKAAEYKFKAETIKIKRK